MLTSLNGLEIPRCRLLVRLSLSLSLSTELETVECRQLNRVLWRLAEWHGLGRSLERVVYFVTCFGLAAWDLGRVVE
jgi:hypothetical protein